jgi:hypothetical protein
VHGGFNLAYLSPVIAVPANVLYDAEAVEVDSGSTLAEASSNG